jgi:hypothetical protein
MAKDEFIEVNLVSWRDEAPRLAAVRRTVFIEEQHVPEALEWDDADVDNVHALALAPDGTPIGTGRLLPDGHIGRMAVLASHRGRGVGAAVLLTLIEAARERGHDVVELAAQLHAIGFYARFGFVAHGPVFDDAGIPHRTMTLRLHRHRGA